MKRLHYTASGLDYIYLANGFRWSETAYGRAFAIEDAASLHRAIACHVVSVPGRLRGQEVRFLRSHLGLTQAGLAGILGTKRQTVVRWEADPQAPIPGTADRALRLYVAVKVDRRHMAWRIAGQLGVLEERANEPAVFRETRTGWTARAA